jgi:hypothetical protein
LEKYNRSALPAVAGLLTEPPGRLGQETCRSN